MRPGRLVRLGASFGCASFPTDGHGYETLLSIADEAVSDKARRKGLATGQALSTHPSESPGGPPVFARIDRPASPRMH